MIQEERFARIQKTDAELRKLQCILELLQWDQEMCLPKKALQERAGQIELVSLLIHARYTSDELANDLAVLGCNAEHPSGSPALSDDQGALLRVLYREQQRKIRLPEKLVGELAQERALAFEVWLKSREENDFTVFSPSLERLVGLSREAAELIGYEGEPYDALLSEYEPDMDTAQLITLFGPLQETLTELLREISTLEKIDTRFLSYKVAEASQKSFNVELLKGLGFDFQRGRLDVSAHPFTASLGNDDVRITTRYQQCFEAIFGTIHEFGHALYELQIDKKWHGSSLAEGTNLSIHESQSRLLENIVGRSMAFWEFWFPKLQKSYGRRFASISLEDFWRGINAVDPEAVRVSADELTYNLHIILRFNIERLFMSGRLEAKHAAEIWGDLSQELLGLRPKDDLHGILQDIHWSHAAFGYFPTYTLGNLCSAQIYQCIKRDIPDIESHFRQGHYAVLSEWLRRHIHSFGKSKSTTEILFAISGEPLRAEYFSTYLQSKYRDVYRV